MTEQNTDMIDILENALIGMYDGIDRQTAGRLVREAAFAPNARTVDTPEGLIKAKELKMKVAGALATGGFDDVSGEYFADLTKTCDILNHTNDGYLSAEDLTERNAFLEKLALREESLTVALALAESIETSKADEFARYIRFKLKKLKEMRTALIRRTNNVSDVETSRQEYEKALPYYKYFKKLSKLPFGYEAMPQEKEMLGLEDDETEDGSAVMFRFLNKILDEMSEREEKHASYKDCQIGRDLENEEHIQKVQHSFARLQTLNARKDSFYAKYKYLSDNPN